jgi:hypothetical protein
MKAENESVISIGRNTDGDKNTINVNNEKPYCYKSKEEIDIIYQEHFNDLIGEFINIVKSHELNPEKEASILTIGLDALLGW